MPNEPVTGRQAIQEMFAREFSVANMQCIIQNIFEDGDTAILEWRDPAGFRGCGFFKVQGGWIVEQRGYWDESSLLRLYGPPVEGPSA